ncbi:MAG: spore protease YyaC [Bacillota bacterium]
MALPVVLCIGSMGVIGDSLGPLVGDILKAEGVNAYVYGCTKRPVTGVNYGEYVEYLKKKHDGVVIAIDASVGDKKDVGKIKIASGGVSAGGALNRDLGRFGDIGIIGIVAEKGEDNLRSLINVPHSAVSIMAMRVALRVNEVLKAIPCRKIESGKEGLLV